MPKTDLLQILLSHDQWATVQVLDVCEKLSPEQLHRRFEIGPGSLHDTLTHIVGAMRAWTETLAGAEPRPRLEQDGQRRTPEQLRALLDESCRDFAEAARRRPLGEIVTRRMRDGNSFEITRGAAVAQVTTHAMHHRAQCLNMLRQLGVTPLPGVSVVEWTWAGNAPR